MRLQQVCNRQPEDLVQCSRQLAENKLTTSGNRTHAEDVQPVGAASRTRRASAQPFRKVGQLGQLRLSPR